MERVNAWIKDDFGGRTIRVRGAVKVMAHLMFGVLAVTVEQPIKIDDMTAHADSRFIGAQRAALEGRVRPQGGEMSQLIENS